MKIIQRTCTTLFKRRIIFLNISSSLGGSWLMSRRIWPVWGSGTLKVSDKPKFSSMIPDHGNKWRILKTKLKINKHLHLIASYEFFRPCNLADINFRISRITSKKKRCEIYNNVNLFTYVKPKLFPC